MFGGDMPVFLFLLLVTASTGSVLSKFENAVGSLEDEAEDGTAILGNDVRATWNEIGEISGNGIESAKATINKGVNTLSQKIYSDEQNVEEDVNQVSNIAEAEFDKDLGKASTVLTSEEKTIEKDVGKVSQVIATEEKNIKKGVERASEAVVSEGKTVIQVVDSAGEKVKNAVITVEGEIQSTGGKIYTWMTSAWTVFCDSFHTILRVCEVVGFFVLLGIFLKIYLQARNLQSFFTDIFTKHSAQRNVPAGVSSNPVGDTRV